jgi:hypothetical protein
MKKCFVVATLVALCATTANATNMWLSNSNTLSPAGEVPMTTLRPGQEGWFYIWARPDEGQTLQNLSLNVVTDDPTGSQLWFTGGFLPNPVLGVIVRPGPDLPFARYEFINDSTNDPNLQGTPDHMLMSLNGMQGFSVANQQTLGVGLGPDTTEGTDPGYNPETDAWLLGSIHFVCHRPGHVGLYLQIGGNGLNNLDQSSSQTNVVFGDPNDVPLNGNDNREQNSSRPDAIIWQIPEPSSIALALLGLIALIPCLRKR